MRVEVEEGLALVALIGNDLSKACGVGKEVFGVLEPFNIRMICYGASSHNLCFPGARRRCRAGSAEAAF